MQSIVLNITVHQSLINRVLAGIMAEKKMPAGLLRIYFKEKTVFLAISARKILKIFPKDKVVIGLLLQEFYLHGRTCHASFKSSSALLNLFLRLAAPVISSRLPGFEYNLTGKILSLSFPIPGEIPENAEMQLEPATEEIRIRFSGDPDDGTIGKMISKLCRDSVKTAG